MNSTRKFLGRILSRDSWWNTQLEQMIPACSGHSKPAQADSGHAGFFKLYNLASSVPVAALSYLKHFVIRGTLEFSLVNKLLWENKKQHVLFADWSRGPDTVVLFFPSFSTRWCMRACDHPLQLAVFWATVLILVVFWLYRCSTHKHAIHPS